MSASTGNQFILGDTFLRSVYTVFDWDNQNAYVAQGDDCGSHIIPIGKGADSVPELVGECGRPTTSSTTSHSKTTSETKTSSHTKTDTMTTSKPTKTGSSSSGSVTSTPSGSTSSHGTVSSTTGWHNGTTTAAPTYTSTVRTTRTYTITSCAPTVTNCPVGHVTTETITSLTTWCPGETAKPTVTETASCPEITGTFTIPAPPCTKSPCASQSAPAVVTVVPITTHSVTVTVPGCHSCGPAPTDVTTPAVTYTATTPAGTAPGISTVTKPCTTCSAPTQSAPVTAGAAKTVGLSAAGVVAAVLAVALM